MDDFNKLKIYMDYYITRLVLKNWSYINLETGFSNIKYLWKDIYIASFDEFVNNINPDNDNSILYWYPRFKERIKIK